MARYSLVVCPRCREHAQIIEVEGSRTTRCQKCSSLLRIRKLNVFYASDSLDEMIQARTSLQVQILGEGKVEGLPVFNGSGKALSDGEIELLLQEKEPKPKRDGRKIIMDLLQKGGGHMELETLRLSALEYMGIEKFDKTIRALMEAGDLYSPSNGIVGLV